MQPLEGRTALVTGAGRGIGRESALAFAAAGAAVVVVDIDEDGGKETVGLIADAGGEATFVAADLTRAADVVAMVERARADLRAARLRPQQRRDPGGGERPPPATTTTSGTRSSPSTRPRCTSA